MNIIEQFRSINPRDPGVMPPLPRALVMVAVFLAVVVIDWAIDWSEQFDQIGAGVAAENTLKQEYRTKRFQAVNLAAYERQYKEVDVTFGTMLRQLPNRQQVESLLVEINQAGLQRGLQFELIKPGQETLREFYAELPIRLRVTGSYHDLGGFAGDLAQLPRIVTLGDIAIQPGTTKDAPLVMDTVARTFRYLDEDESLAQKRASQAGRARK
jgi:type IV pilus assembly protein PilO